MKKLVAVLCLVGVLGLVSVSAQEKKKEVKKAPVKTEQGVVKGTEKGKSAKIAEAAKPVDKTKKTKKVAPKKG